MRDYTGSSLDGEYAQDSNNAKTRIYTTLIAMSLIFFIIDLVQIALIYTVNSIYWIVLFPALVFTVFMAILLYQCITYRLLHRWRQSK